MNKYNINLYNNWRTRILVYIVFGYGAYYLCRQNFYMILPLYLEEYNYSKTQLGWILTMCSIIYGTGKFINGYISDRSDARYFITIGLLGSAIVNIILGSSNCILHLTILLAINHWFQSMGWPAVARMLTYWFSYKEFGTKWAIASSSHQIGGAVSFILTGTIITYLHWRMAFVIPGIIAFIISLILFNRLRDSPGKINLPEIEVFDGDRIIRKHNQSYSIIKSVLINKNIWLIAFANLCLNVVRVSIVTWAPLFFIEFKKTSLFLAGWYIAIYEICCLLGGLLAGLVHDKYEKKSTGIVGASFMLCLATNLVLLWQLSNTHIIFNCIIVFFVGFFVYASQVLVGISSAHCVSKDGIGTANGFVGVLGYLGSSISGVCIGIIIDNLGWREVFLYLISFTLLGAVFFLACRFR